MSRSVKKHPIVCYTCCGSNIAGLEKYYKTLTNRRIRRAAKNIDIPSVCLIKNNYSNIWTYPKDGKHWWDDPKAYRK